MLYLAIACFIISALILLLSLIFLHDAFKRKEEFKEHLNAFVGTSVLALGVFLLGMLVWYADEKVDSEYASKANEQQNEQQQKQEERNIQVVQADEGSAIVHGTEEEAEALAQQGQEEAQNQIEAEAKLEKKLEKIISNYGDVILDIRSGPRGWINTHVIVSDAWYYMPNYMKERLAITVGTEVEMAVKMSGVSDNAFVDFYDSFGKKVANRKLLGAFL